MSKMVLRRAQLDEKVKKQIRDRVKKLLQQKKSDPEQSDSADEQPEEDNKEGTVYLFDASDHSRSMVAVMEMTKRELETYKREHKLDPTTKVKIISPKDKGKKDDGEKRGPAKDEEKSGVPSKKPDEKKDKSKKVEEKTPPVKAPDKQKDVKEPEDKKEDKKDKKPEEREPGEPLEHSHPARMSEGPHRQVAIKDRLIDEFGTDAKDWKVHKLDKSQLSFGVTIKFPDGTEKKYGQLSPDEKGRVDRAVVEGLAASKGLLDYTNVSPATLQYNMKASLDIYDDPDVEESKNDSEDVISKENMGEFTSGIRESGRTVLKKYRGAMSSVSRPMAEKLVDSISDSITEAVRDGSMGNVKQRDLDEFVRESVKRVLHQELETRRRSLGDHGIRHVAGNCQSTMKMLNELQGSGMKITGKQKLMALATMVDHDIGYTVGEVGTNISMGKKHKENSVSVVNQEKERMDTIFGREDGDKVRAMIATHDDQNYEWESDPVASSVRLADNTSLFGNDKVQDLFLRSPKATELACKLHLAAQAKPDDKKLQDDIKNQMHEVVDGDEFEAADRDSLHAQINEMSEGKFSTTTDILSRFSGKLDGFKYDADKKMMNVNMRYSSEGQMVDQLFGDEVACRQFDKMADGLDGQPVRGKRGNTIFKNKDTGKPAFQLNIDGFAEEDDPQTAAMRDFANKTARTELRRASMLMYSPPPAVEKDIAKAKKAIEPAKEKFSEAEWDKLMKAFDDGAGDPGALAKQLGMWPLLQSETAFLTSKTASSRIVRRLFIASLADKIAKVFLGDTTLQEAVCVDREFNKDVVGSRGQQTQRKDKDLMVDTGGVSKGRRREPDQKPSRSDSIDRYRTKDKTPEERDPDIDVKASEERAQCTGIEGYPHCDNWASYERMTSSGDWTPVCYECVKTCRKQGWRTRRRKFSSMPEVHPLDFKVPGMFGLMLPEENYHRQVLFSLVNIMADIQKVSEKNFAGMEELQKSADQLIRMPKGEEMIQTFIDVGARPEMCAEGLYFEMVVKGKTASFEAMAKSELARSPRTLREAVSRGVR
jgi:hypothetical protein